MSNIKYVNPDKYEALKAIYITGQALLKRYGQKRLNIPITCKDKEIQDIYEKQEKERNGGF
jgi:hypothetical protein